MAKLTKYQVAKEVADATKELQDEGLLDEWGAAFGQTLASNILKRRKQPRQNVAPQKEAAE